MGAKGTEIIFGGGVYVAEKYFSRSERRIVRLWRSTEAQSEALVSIGRSRPGGLYCQKGRRGLFDSIRQSR